ncbi:uncharacterized protein LOC127788533 isoform X1 [Diospyros lotus]|uniref:uncharacterized protein LOC127788533 isoform X1 n=1 Tax=Diospyros lotus TaxID=55363 RepID=UPI0022501599|nr:uncharacterized protein LOC127788533 isoform X1 [Diospyros lotus]
MGKPLTKAAATATLRQLGGITAQLISSPTKPISPADTARTGCGQVERRNLKKRKMENNCGGGGGSGSSSNSSNQLGRTPLSGVVSDCVKRWFQDTLKEAKAGDVSMQVLVGQMYYNGYGVAKDAQKGRIWMTRASRVRSSVWKVSNKRPGYNASDSDSDELNGNS